MKNRKRGIRRTLLAVAFVGAIAVAAVALTSEPAAAKPPTGPLCGPTILFECTFRNGSTRLVGLTICELASYERKHHATCEPFSG